MHSQWLAGSVGVVTEYSPATRRLACTLTPRMPPHMPIAHSLRKWSRNAHAPPYSLTCWLFSSGCNRCFPKEEGQECGGAGSPHLPPSSSRMHTADRVAGKLSDATHHSAHRSSQAAPQTSGAARGGQRRVSEQVSEVVGSCAPLFWAAQLLSHSRQLASREATPALACQ